MSGVVKKTKKPILVSFRVNPERKRRYLRAVARLGFKDLSAFLVSTADAVAGQVDAYGWECHLIHIDGDKIVGFGEKPDSLPGSSMAFPIVAPERFWRHLRRALSSEWDIQGR